MAPDDDSADNPGNSPKDHDRALFLQAVGQVRPLAQQYIKIERPKPKARGPGNDRTRFATLLDDYTPPIDGYSGSGGPVQYRRDGVQIQTLRKLRRGHYRIDNELDLHGLTVEEARQHTKHFLHHCQQQGQRCIRLIPGKGKPDAPSKIRAMLEHWLPVRKEVLAFCSAQPAQGGSGALLLLLRRDSSL